MKQKIIGIFICTLMIVTVVPVVGNPNISIYRDGEILDYHKYNEIVPSKFIVKFTDKSAMSSPSIINLNKRYKVNSIEKVFNNAEGTILSTIYVLSIPEDSDILSIIHEYASCPDVVYAEPCGLFHLCSNDPDIIYSSPRNNANFNVIPNDENFSFQWALHNTGQHIWPDALPPINGTPDSDIDAVEAWEIETGKPDIIIAIIDSGIDYTHPDLADNIWINDNEIPGNSIDDDSNGYIDDVMGWDFYHNDSDPLDGMGHGTHCAGIASAIANNNIGIAGVCWNCKIMNIQIINETNHGAPEIPVLNALKYAADNGADVMSNSWGTYDYYQSLQDTLNYCHGKGVFICAAAGNENTSQKLYPAGHENVTAVAATDQHDERCDDDDWDPFNWYTMPLGSNFGDWVDVAAPGNLIYSTMPTYHVWFNNYWNQWRCGGFYQNYYDYLGGTSMATPYVAGLAALLLSKNPDLTPDEVEALICENVDPYISEVYLGTGRINAFKALKALTSRPQLNITSITGGFGVNAVVKNSGDKNASNVETMVTVTGGIFKRINTTVTNLTPLLSIDHSQSVKTDMFFGLGKITITISANCTEGQSCTQTKKGFQFFIYTLVAK